MKTQQNLKQKCGLTFYPHYVAITLRCKGIAQYEADGMLMFNILFSEKMLNIILKSTLTFF